MFGRRRHYTLKKMSDMKVSERRFFPSRTVVLDLEESPYFCIKVFGASRKIEDMDLAVTRTGEGIGEFRYQGGRSVGITCVDNPLLNYFIPSGLERDESDGDEIDVEQSFFIVPQGYKGSERDFIREFFPGYLSYHDANEKAVKEGEERIRQGSGSSETDIVKRKKQLLFQLSKSPSHEGKELVKMIEEIRAAGGSLTEAEARRCFRVQSSLE